MADFNADLATLLDDCDDEHLVRFLKLPPHQREALLNADLPEAGTDFSTFMLHTNVVNRVAALAILSTERIAIHATAVQLLEQVQYDIDSVSYEVTQVTPKKLGFKGHREASEIFTTAEALHNFDMCPPELIIDFFRQKKHLDLQTDKCLYVAMKPIVNGLGNSYIFAIYKDKTEVVWLEAQQLTSGNSEPWFTEDSHWLFIKKKVIASS